MKPKHPRGSGAVLRICGGLVFLMIFRQFSLKLRFGGLSPSMFLGRDRLLAENRVFCGLSRSMFLRRDRLLAEIFVSAVFPFSLQFRL